MKVSFNANVMTIVTPIVAADMDKILTEAILKDEHNNAVYAVGTTTGACGGISEKIFTANTVVDGKLALTIQLPNSMNVAEAKKEYGVQLVAAKEYLPKMAAKIAAEIKAVDTIFEEAE